MELEFHAICFWKCWFRYIYNNLRKIFKKIIGFLRVMKYLSMIIQALSTHLGHTSHVVWRRYFTQWDGEMTAFQTEGHLNGQWSYVVRQLQVMILVTDSSVSCFAVRMKFQRHRSFKVSLYFYFLVSEIFLYHTFSKI